ncbi:MAG: ORF6N domain-containing protein [Candidatus Udaeobacter sp.]
MPQKSKSPIPIEQIDALICMVRGARVILDRDLAKIYGVPTFRFNEAIKRNRHRFPADFMFQLTRSEFDSLTSQIAMSKLENSSQNAMSKPRRGGRRTLPYAFTEHGALQAANVLRSPRAVQMSVFVIRAFVKMRETLLGTRELAKKLAALEKKLTSRLDVHEAAIVQVLQEIMQILNPPPLPPGPPRRRIGFHES